MTSAAAAAMRLLTTTTATTAATSTTTTATATATTAAATTMPSTPLVATRSPRRSAFARHLRRDNVAAGAPSSSRFVSCVAGTVASSMRRASTTTTTTKTTMTTATATQRSVHSLPASLAFPRAAAGAHAAALASRTADDADDSGAGEHASLSSSSSSSSTVAGPPLSALFDQAMLARLLRTVPRADCPFFPNAHALASFLVNYERSRADERERAPAWLRALVRRGDASGVDADSDASSSAPPGVREFLEAFARGRRVDLLERTWQTLVDDVAAGVHAPPDVYEFNALLLGYKLAGDYERVVATFARHAVPPAGDGSAASTLSFVPNVRTYNLLIDTEVARGDLAAALRFASLLRGPPAFASPNRRTYNLLIKAHTQLGSRDDADAAFDRLRADGFAPDYFTYAFLDPDGTRFPLADRPSPAVTPLLDSHRLRASPELRAWLERGVVKRGGVGDAGADVDADAEPVRVRSLYDQIVGARASGTVEQYTDTASVEARRLFEETAPETVEPANILGEQYPRFVREQQRIAAAAQKKRELAGDSSSSSSSSSSTAAVAASQRFTSARSIKGVPFDFDQDMFGDEGSGVADWQPEELEIDD